MRWMPCRASSQRTAELLLAPHDLPAADGAAASRPLVLGALLAPADAGGRLLNSLATWGAAAIVAAGM